MPLLILIPFFQGCRSESPETAGRIVVGIDSDVKSFNPLFSSSANEVNISELLFLGLVQYEWNNAEGGLDASPMLAEKWEWADDSSSIKLYLRKDVRWSDGRIFNAEDVVFSFDVYSDPKVESRFYGFFENFYLNNKKEDSLHILLDKTFEVKDSFTVKINFRKNSIPSLKDIDYPLIPRHVYEHVERKDLGRFEKDINLVTDGPFFLERWDKNQAIILKRNENSFLYASPGNLKPVQRLVFKIVPDYNSRFTQLKKGEIDLMDDINPENVSSLKEIGRINIASVKGREFEYIGWNNINTADFKEGKITPNKLFGNSEIRKALSYAVNKQEILSEYLKGYGDLAAGPVSPIFKKYFDKTLKPFEYNPGKAKEILNRQGWIDEDKNGIIEKNRIPFRFVLNIPGGNPRREFAATVIKNNLHEIGIDVSVQSYEPGVFFEKLFSREFDSWIAAWGIPLPLDLKPFWHSNLRANQYNLAGFRNKSVDSLLELIIVTKDDNRKTEYYKKIQKIIYNEAPFTFLYWIDNIVAYNKRIKNINVTPLYPLHHAWNWKLED
ncbi:MAG TPA: ABC transporter substrate-binding protein [Ignavibacteriaceae bacterium]|nr:ABC transporter substrate-binding protein [Ignavibacteriaceae bacterium]